MLELFKFLMCPLHFLGSPQAQQTLRHDTRPGPHTFILPYCYNRNEKDNVAMNRETFWMDVGSVSVPSRMLYVS